VTGTRKEGKRKFLITEISVLYAFPVIGEIKSFDAGIEARRDEYVTVERGVTLIS
jgi:hypothetical protein